MKRLLVILMLIPTFAFAFTNQDGVGIYNQFVFGASTVNTVALQKNADRAYLFIQNQSGASTLTIDFVGSSTVGVQLTSGQTFTGAIASPVWLKSSAGIVNALVIEGIH